MKKIISIIILMITASSCTKEQIKISDPFNFKTYQIQKSNLEDKQFIIEYIFRCV